LKRINEELVEATLKKVQLKLLQLVGSFGHVLDMDSDGGDKHVLAETDPYLKYAVPFQDIKPDVYLGNILLLLFE